MIHRNHVMMTGDIAWSRTWPNESRGNREFIPNHPAPASQPTFFNGISRTCQSTFAQLCGFRRVCNVLLSIRSPRIHRNRRNALEI